MYIDTRILKVSLSVKYREKHLNGNPMTKTVSYMTQTETCGTLLNTKCALILHNR